MRGSTGAKEREYVLHVNGQVISLGDSKMKAFEFANKHIQEGVSELTMEYHENNDLMYTWEFDGVKWNVV